MAFKAWASLAALSPSWLPMPFCGSCDFLILRAVAAVLGIARLLAVLRLLGCRLFPGTGRPGRAAVRCRWDRSSDSCLDRWARTSSCSTCRSRASLTLLRREGSVSGFGALIAVGCCLSPCFLVVGRRSPYRGSPSSCRRSRLDPSSRLPACFDPADFREWRGRSWRRGRRRSRCSWRLLCLLRGRRRVGRRLQGNLGSLACCLAEPKTLS